MNQMDFQKKVIREEYVENEKKVTVKSSIENKAITIISKNRTIINQK